MGEQLRKPAIAVHGGAGSARQADNAWVGTAAPGLSPALGLGVAA